VFYITAGVYAFGAIFYGLFGSAELQPWAIPSQSIQNLEIEVNVIPDDGEESEKKSTT